MDGGKRPTTAWSKDGIHDWQSLAQPATAYNNSIQLASGGMVNLERRERHQMLVGDDGEPITLFNGVMTPKSLNGNSYTFTAASPIRTDKSMKLPSDV